MSLDDIVVEENAAIFFLAQPAVDAGAAAAGVPAAAQGVPAAEANVAAVLPAIAPALDGAAGPVAEAIAAAADPAVPPKARKPTAVKRGKKIVWIDYPAYEPFNTEVRYPPDYPIRELANAVDLVRG